MLSLRGPGEWENELCVLNKIDIRGPGADVEEGDQELSGHRARKKYKMPLEKQNMRIGEEQDPTHIGQHVGEGRREVLWIWINAQVLTAAASDSGFLEGKHSYGCHITDLCIPAMKIEWMKSQAHVCHWTEEVELLLEEMQRVVVSLQKLQRDGKRFRVVLKELMKHCLMVCEHMHCIRLTFTVAFRSGLQCYGQDKTSQQLTVIVVKRKVLNPKQKGNTTGWLIWSNFGCAGHCLFCRSVRIPLYSCCSCHRLLYNNV